MPWPPPTHIVMRPVCLSWCCSELTIVDCSRAPVMPNGWPTAIDAAVDVEPVDVDAELLVGRHDLGGERLVDLDQVDVVDAHAGAGEGLLARLDRAHAHDLGGQAGEAGRHDPGQRLEAELGGLGVGHDDDRGGAVVERAAVAGGHDAVGAEDRLELRDLLVGDAGARAVVLVPRSCRRAASPG